MACVSEPKSLITAAKLKEHLPMSDAANNTVTKALADVRSVLSGADDRLIVIVGPCSIHDPAGAIEYASKLKALKDKYSSELVVMMRVYFEKPHTTVGWRGLINDPDLNSTFNVNTGLRTARKVLLDINVARLTQLEARSECKERSFTQNMQR